MAMTNIIQSITSFVQEHLVPPLTAIPAMMLICSTLKRPGLSPIQITARTINRMGEKGMLIGSNIDGSENLTNQMVFMIVDEIVKAIQLDSKVEVGVSPGAITSQGVVPPGGGPVVVTNTTYTSLSGITR